MICLHSYTCILSKRCNYLNECSPSLFIARTKFTVPFSYSKLSPFREARDALILYIFDDETDLCNVLFDLVRSHTPEYVNSADTVPD